MEYGERDLLQEQGPIIPLRFSYAVEHPGGYVVEHFWDGPMVRGRALDLLDQLWAFEMAVRYEARRVESVEQLPFKRFQKARKTW